jgi:uncharacterized protein YwgA
VKEELTERQKKLVGIIASLTEKPVTISQLQKIVFLWMEDFKKIREIGYTYKVGHYGPFSNDLISDLKELQEKGVIQIKDNQVVVRVQPEDASKIAKDAVNAFNIKFPDAYSIAKSALDSPSVRGHSIGEIIKMAKSEVDAAKIRARSEIDAAKMRTKNEVDAAKVRTRSEVDAAKSRLNQMVSRDDDEK